MRIVPATAVGGAARLESLVLRVFGGGDRPAGWFARKLLRERVDDALSRVAIAEGIDPASPRAWLGYVLVGTPPSLGNAARTAGTGVLASARGRGVGRALVEAAASSVAAAGYARLQIFADENAIPFYEHMGLRVRERVGTLRANASGHAVQGEPADAWTPAALPEARVLQAWSPEAWQGSDGRRTLWLHTDERDVACVHVSLEGTAWLVHRWLVDRNAPLQRVVVESARRLLAALPAPAAVLVPFVSAVSSITDAWRREGFVVMQRAALMERPLDKRAA